MLSENSELIYNIYITIVFAVLFLVILYYFTPTSNYRLYLQNKYVFKEQ